MSDQEWNFGNDPDFKAWAAHQHAHVMPMIRDAEVTMQLVPQSETDIKFAVELGMSIMLDKPIVTVITPGQEINAHLRRVSDAVVEFDPNDGRTLQAAIAQVMDQLDD